MADESLSKALAARAEQLSSGSPAKETPAEEVPSEGSAEQGDGATEPPDGKGDDKPADPAKPTEPEKPVPPKDAVADELAKIARASQAASQRQRDLDAREAAIKTRADAIARAEALEAAAKTDPLKAIELLLGPDALTGNLPFQLIDAAVARQQGKPAPTPEEQESALIAKVKAEAVKEMETKQAEAAKKQADELQARREAGKASYFSQLDAYTKANASKYPLMAAEGIDVTDAETFIDSHYATTGKLATADEVLGHFEKQLEARAERLAAIIAARKGTATAAAAPATPAASPASGAKPAVDTRGKASTPKRVTDFEEDRRARAAALDRR
ncbi:MAG TPA: hypothetical protein VGA61_09105 [Anaerolineae bacterium]